MARNPCYISFPNMHHLIKTRKKTPSKNETHCFQMTRSVNYQQDVFKIFVIIGTLMMYQNSNYQIEKSPLNVLIIRGKLKLKYLMRTVFYLKNRIVSWSCIWCILDWRIDNLVFKTWNKNGKFIGIWYHQKAVNALIDRIWNIYT